MKITKGRLKRIIKEEKAKLMNESLEQYRATYHADGVQRTQEAEANLEAAVLEMLGALQSTLGYNQEEAADTVLGMVEDVIGR